MGRVHIRRCGKRPPPPIRTARLGKWRRDGHWTKAYHGSFHRCIPSSISWAVQDLYSDFRVTRNRTTFTGNVPPRKHARRVAAASRQRSPGLAHCLLTSLPAELLLQICALVVPTETIYNVLPYAAGVPRHGISLGNRVIVIERILNTASEHVAALQQPHRLALAQTCKTLNEAVSTVFYGSNSFIMQIAVGRVLERIRVPGLSSDALESCIRAYIDPRFTLWPITERTAKYITNLSLSLITLRQPGVRETGPLQEQMDRIVDMFLPRHNLRHLTITLGLFQHNAGLAGVQETMRLALTDDGTITTESIPAGGPYLHGRSVLEPLKRLHGVREVSVDSLCCASGECVKDEDAITEDFVETLRSELQRPLEI